LDFQEETEAAKRETLDAQQQLAEAQEKIQRLEEQLAASKGKCVGFYSPFAFVWRVSFLVCDNVPSIQSRARPSAKSTNRWS
jgi:hypothetical protein